MRPARFALLCALLGCGKDPTTSGDDDPPPDATGSDFMPPTGFTRLVGRTWDLPVGANIYKCVRLTVSQDTYITSVVAQGPNGTHHTVLSLVGANGTEGPDGEYDCTARNIGMHLLYGAGLGTSPMDFPSGVGIKVAAGQQLHLNLHLFNASDAPLTGESAIWVKAQSTPPPMLAEMVFAGPIDINVPPDNQSHVVTGQCTATNAYTLFAVWPHMHRKGKQQKVELVHGNTTTVLHDKSYSFEEQAYDKMDPMPQVAVGDRVRVSCTYVNDSGEVVTYGDQANQEMCFAGLYRFPAVGSNEYCPE